MNPVVDPNYLRSLDFGRFYFFIFFLLTYCIPEVLTYLLNANCLILNAYTAKIMSRRATRGDWTRGHLWHSITHSDVSRQDTLYNWNHVHKKKSSGRLEYINIGFLKFKEITHSKRTMRSGASRGSAQRATDAADSQLQSACSSENIATAWQPVLRETRKRV